LNSLEIFVQTHNRPNVVGAAIQSVLDQEFCDFKLVVSDSSNNSLTSTLLENFVDERLSYVRRDSALSPIGHLNLILSEVKADYFMVFHDDDMMLPNCLGELMEAFNSNNRLVAVGANARNLVDGIAKGRTLKSRNDVLIRNPRELFTPYTKYRSSLVPFDSYMYRKVVAQKVKADCQEGGKHADVTFLLNVSSLGEIRWIAKPLILYGTHSGQGSATNNFLDRMGLIYAVCKKADYSRRDEAMVKYRIGNICEEIRSGDYASQPSYILRNKRRLLYLMLQRGEYYYS